MYDMSLSYIIFDLSFGIFILNVSHPIIKIDFGKCPVKDFRLIFVASCDDVQTLDQPKVKIDADKLKGKSVR